MHAYHALILSLPRVFLAKVPFLISFGPDINTKMGVVIYMYLKHSPDYDSKYGSNSIGPSVSAETLFLAFF